ncbi:MAG TPA: CYTH domain-containing protein [Candidatus Saccharimonadales bacterium]|nr:CYTH domain-containing protein [Candidatus Saccharimonadales bacterium]
MKPEIEAKFLAVDHEALRAKLQEIGAVCRQPMRLMKRRGYDFPDNRLRDAHNGWVRVRNEGDKITMSYKQLDNRGLDGTKEIQLTIDSFEAADAFLCALGLEPNVYQETKRESWTLGDCEIELDHWPWTKPYVEMEAPDEQTLRGLAAKLGLDWAQVKHGSVEIVYRGEYDVTDAQVNAIPQVTFEDPVPEVLARAKRASGEGAAAGDTPA